MASVLIFGASGKVGRSVVAALRAKGIDPILWIRQKQSNDKEIRDGVVCGDFQDSDLVERTCRGIDTVFSYAPDITYSDVFFRAIKRAGVNSVVLLSSASVISKDAGANPIAKRHLIAETAIVKNCANWYFLRPDTMASNALDWCEDIASRKKVFVPFPESKRNPIHESDIADVAAMAICGNLEENRVLHLTGPEILTIRDQVNAISDIVGRPIECVQIDEEIAIKSIMKQRKTISFDSARKLIDYQRRSQYAVPLITKTYEEITGNEGRGFSMWVEDNKYQFLCPGRVD